MRVGFSMHSLMRMVENLSAESILKHYMESMFSWCLFVEIVFFIVKLWFCMAILLRPMDS
jgi:hypothetical protein